MQTKLNFCLLFLILSVSRCQSQLREPEVVIGEEDTVGYRFIDQERNAIGNERHLEPFYEKLLEQRTRGGKKITVVHIGDSHILGNYLTREVRARLQREFGDGGRGVIFPYKLAGTNGPRDYLVSASGNWDGNGMMKDQDGPTPFGLCGFNLYTFNPNAELTFRLRDTATAETETISKITVFQHEKEKEFNLEVYDEVSKQSATLYLEGDYSRSYYFDRPVGQFSVAARRTDPRQKKLSIDGISVDNELAGVMYHSIGVNGAKFSDFSRAKYFAAQVADLQPDLIILSFGTNEAQGKTAGSYIYGTIDALVRPLRERCGGTRILLTTPADSYIRGGGFNPNFAEVCSEIRKYARDNDLSLWDLHQLGGGSESAQLWKSNNLMSSDSVHYSKAGYAVQGRLLYLSLISGYNRFATETGSKE